MNMSYCRFHNTYYDLVDCENALEEFMYGDSSEISSKEERVKARQLISLCQDIVDNYSVEDFEEKCKEYEEEKYEEDNE